MATSKQHPTSILDIHCSGTPYEIGHTHGTHAAPIITRTIAFYTTLFQRTARLPWASVRSLALQFQPLISAKWPSYLSEMRGIADGAGVGLEDILAINVRTEIAFGLFSDGCTSLSWCQSGASGFSYLAQNWDWNPAQKQNLIRLTITQPPLPTIKMITEAGLIGKIGFNSEGLGVCFNAIRAPGLSLSKIPSHLALRLILDSRSRQEAVEALEREGVAASCHILIMDAGGEGVGMECTSQGIRKVEASSGVVTHTNHLLLEQEDVVDTVYLEDSKPRNERMGVLVRKLAEKKNLSGKTVSVEDVQRLFEDEEGLPGAICRVQKDVDDSETLFNIVMDLRRRKAWVRMGRPGKKVDEEFVTMFNE